MAENKGFNPFSLDLDKDEPTFTNEVGIRWWQLALGDSQDGVPFRVDGDMYVIVKDRKVIYDTQNLEQLCVQFDIMRINREMP